MKIETKEEILSRYDIRYIRDEVKYGAPGYSSEGRNCPSEQDPAVIIQENSSSKPNFMTASQCKTRINQVISLLTYCSGEFTEDQKQILREEIEQLENALKGK